ncbi:peptide chain release factor N(5)-glutamine methyltransferase [soil metagenome]
MSAGSESGAAWGMSSMINTGMTIDALLQQALLSPMEARILLSHVLQLSRVQLITQGERVFGADEAQRLSDMFARRIKGEPIAYIVGEREFYGLEFHVTPDVLIPRPDTELLVELALELMPKNGRVLDMGTGSGAIAIAVAHALPDVEVTALDASAAALQIAQKNADRHRVHVSLVLSDWYAGLGNKRFDLIVSNPPYIVSGDPHLSQGDLHFEPLNALTDHGDGLQALRTIIADAASHLTDEGWLLLEHGYDQAQAVRELLAAQGFREVESWLDLANIERVSGGKMCTRT